MFHHVVLFQFKRGHDATIHRRMRAFCRNIKKSHPGTISCAYAENGAERFSGKHPGNKGASKGYTHTFVAVFDNARSHDRYQQCELHQALVPHLVPQLKDFLICDYQTR
ncbi:MAG: Dabb family protein [Alphaproteobacteria bacterium]|nr:Dabb family protein [Alphaproteobacteria bacterium]